ncbi:hypothetical protein L2095_23700 [Bacillus zanthoxyli]|nr:hypothetical protein [Bacillus zanthoxyli]
MDFSEFKMTEEKVRKLKPIIEKILSRKYGREIKIMDITMGGITVKSEKE